MVKDQLGGTALADYRVARTAVADELARVFQGTGVAAEQEKARWLDALDHAQNPAQFRRVIGRMQSLLEGRMDALAEQHDRGMNYSADNPKSRVKKAVDADLPGASFLEGKQLEKYKKVKEWVAGPNAAAIKWLKDNPDDPDAPAVRKKLGL